MKSAFIGDSILQDRSKKTGSQEREDAGRRRRPDLFLSRSEKNLSQKKVQKSLTEKKRGRKALKEKGLVIFDA